MHPYVYLGRIRLESYWLMNIIGLSLLLYISILEARRKGIKVLKLISFIIFLTPISWMGGRIGYLLLHDPQRIVRDPISVLTFWRGGLSAYGGIIIGVIFAVVLSKLFKFRFWQISDTLAPGIALAHSIGRIGCFLNGCCYGKFTSVPWAVVYVNDDAIAPKMTPLHPTQIYESILDFLMFLFLWFMRKRYKTEGVLFLNYIIIYSLIRSIVVFFRAESIPLFGEYLYFTHLLAIIGIMVSFILILYLKRRPL